MTVKERIEYNRKLDIARVSAFEMYYWKIYADVRNMTVRFGLALIASAADVDEAALVAWSEAYRSRGRRTGRSGCFTGPRAGHGWQKRPRVFRGVGE